MIDLAEWWNYGVRRTSVHLNHQRIIQLIKMCVAEDTLQFQVYKNPTENAGRKKSVKKSSPESERCLSDFDIFRCFHFSLSPS